MSLYPPPHLGHMDQNSETMHRQVALAQVRGSRVATIYTTLCHTVSWATNEFQDGEYLVCGGELLHSQSNPAAKPP